MHSAKGFRKRYFSLAAITALNAQIKTRSAFAKARSIDAFERNESFREGETESQTPPIAALALAAAIAIAPAAHCDSNASFQDLNRTFSAKPVSIETDSLPIRALDANGGANDETLKNQLDRFSAFTQNATTSIGSIEGAPARFSAVFWEGIAIGDSSAIDGQPSFINQLALGGDRVRFAQGAVQSALGEGGSGAFLISGDRAAPSEAIFGGSNRGERFQNARIKLGKYGYVAAANRDLNAYTAVAKEAGKLDKSSEKDRLQSTSFKGAVSIPIAQFAKIDLKALDAIGYGEYDAGYPTDPDDAKSAWDTHLSVQGAEATIFPSDLWAIGGGFHHSFLRRHNRANNQTYRGENAKPFAFVDLFLGAADLRIGAEQKREKAYITAQIDDAENRRDDIYAILSARFGAHKIDLAARYSRYDPERGDAASDTGYRAAWGAQFGRVGLELSESRAINAPTIYQQFNPWGARNDSLKQERLDQTRGEISAKWEAAEVSIALWRTRVKDYIDWVDNANWALSRYENIERLKFSGSTARAVLKPLDGLTIDAEFTKYFDFKTSLKDYEKRQPKQTATIAARYDRGEFYGGVGARLGAGFTDAASGEKLEGERRLWAFFGYENKDGFGAELTVRNILDEYRETTYGYTPDDPERAVSVSARQKF